jgi:diguanylate cyclase (GGDEF)-like protein
MASTRTLDLSTCEREPIQIPGSIQPHGLLLVIDQSNDQILQAAGDAAQLLGYRGEVLGETTHEVLGTSLVDLLQLPETVLVREPTYLGFLEPGNGKKGLVITGHQAHATTILELEPAGAPASAARTLASIRSMTERLSDASELTDACFLAAREVRRLTGFDRVMVYQFLSDCSGVVVAEDKDAHLTPFLNHRYPASDIPKQARELYRRSALRIIPNVEYTPAPIMPMRSPLTDEPLDMSQCILRSVSPVHLRYLKNMGVGASMSVSLLPSGKLWGLIACHNATAKFLPYEVQEKCRHVGHILSQQIWSREEVKAYRRRHELAGAQSKLLGDLSGDDAHDTLLDLCAELQTAIPSNGVAVCWRGSVAKAGEVPPESCVRQLAMWLLHEKSQYPVFVTDRLSEHYSEAVQFTAEASGLLSITLVSDEPTILMWFRAEQVEEINWAGNPHEPAEPGISPGTLNPRKSFATWKEEVRGRSTPWEPVVVESAEIFASRIAFVLQQRRVRDLNGLLRKANEQLSTLATTDALTGVANRRAFDEFLDREWARASRVSRPLALTIVDVDFFKQYNDFFGHLMGDECLKQVAQALQESRRETDFVARIGGEEFAIVLPDTDRDGARNVAEAARARIEKLRINHPKSPTGFVTASFGVATRIPEETGTVQDLIQVADQALYDAKNSGRNRVVCAEQNSPMG